MLRVPSNLYVVVIDIGQAYTKLGYSCENSPSAIIKTEVNGVKILQSSKQIIRTPDEWYQLFVDFFHEIAFRVMLTNLKDRDVTIVESMSLLTSARIAIAKVLFKHFEVASLAYLITPLAAICPLAIQTALVVNCGNSRTEIVSVCGGIVMISSRCSFPYAARHVHIRLHEILAEDNADVSLLTEAQLEDIKVKCCFVTTRKRSELYFNDEEYRNARMNVEYLVRGGRTINVSSAARELSFEDIFLYNDFKCLASVILESISRSPIDYRKELFKNILVIGGTSMARGFKQRLLEDLKRLTEENGNCYITRDKRVIPVRPDDIRIFVDLPAKENCLPWLGGAIYSSSGFSRTRSITKNNYLKNENIINIGD